MKYLAHSLIALMIFVSPCWGGASRDFIPGNNDYIELSDIDLGNSFTLSAWVYVDTIDQVAVITENYTGSGRVSFVLGWGLSADTTDTQFGFFSAGWHLVTSTVDISTGQWVHLAGTWNGTTAILYYDGVLHNSATPGGTSGDDNDVIFIGRRHDAVFGEYFDGRIAYPQIHDDALTVEQINEIMYCPHNLVGTLVALLPLNGNDATEEDLSGNDNHGTVNGPDEYFDGPPISVCGGAK